MTYYDPAGSYVLWSSCCAAMDGVAAVIRKVVSEIYSDGGQARTIKRNDIKIQLESGNGIGRNTVLKDPAGNLIGYRGVESSLKTIHETGVFPTILGKAGAPQEVIDLYAAVPYSSQVSS